MGSKYAKVFPEPVSACMNASVLSFNSAGIATFWIAVGALMASLFVRCAAIEGVSPSVVKLSCSLVSGAFEGSTGLGSKDLDSVSIAVLELGLEVKREEMTCLGPSLLRSSRRALRAWDTGAVGREAFEI
jgi:hypothetical protein